MIPCISCVGVCAVMGEYDLCFGKITAKPVPHGYLKNIHPIDHRTGETASDSISAVGMILDVFYLNFHLEEAA